MPSVISLISITCCSFVYLVSYRFRVMELIISRYNRVVFLASQFFLINNVFCEVIEVFGEAFSLVGCWCMVVVLTQNIMAYSNGLILELLMFPTNKHN